MFTSGAFCSLTRFELCARPDAAFCTVSYTVFTQPVSTEENKERKKAIDSQSSTVNRRETIITLVASLLQPSETEGGRSADN